MQWGPLRPCTVAQCVGRYHAKKGPQRAQNIREQVVQGRIIMKWRIKQRSEPRWRGGVTEIDAAVANGTYGNEQLY